MASLLATKALQGMLTELKDENLQQFMNLRNDFEQQFAEFSQYMEKVVSKVKSRSRSKARPKDLNTLEAPHRPDDLLPETELEPP